MRVGSKYTREWTRPERRMAYILYNDKESGFQLSWEGAQTLLLELEEKAIAATSEDRVQAQRRAISQAQSPEQELRSQPVHLQESQQSQSRAKGKSRDVALTL